MEGIKLIYHGGDEDMNESWIEEYDAFLIDDLIVALFEENELWIKKFPNSLSGKDTVDYWPGTGNVESFQIEFQQFNNWHTFDLSKPLKEIIGESRIVAMSFCEPRS